MSYLDSRQPKTAGSIRWPGEGPRIVFATFSGVNWCFVVKNGMVAWPPAPLRRETIGRDMRVQKTEWEVWKVKDGQWVMELVSEKPKRQPVTLYPLAQILGEQEPANAGEDLQDAAEALMPVAS